MSVFTMLKKHEQPSKVPNSAYIRTENKPEDDTPKPAEPPTPTPPAAQ